jgi:hypothetical protein
MLMAGRALLQGASIVARSPAILLLTVFVTMTAALPFALLVGARVQASLANRPPVSAASQDIDAEWWMEYRAHARGLEATFTPAILGFAAPLSNLSGLLDGTVPALPLAGPLVLSLVLWGLLWGGILDRYCVESAAGLRRFGAAAFRFAPRMLAIGAGAAVVNVILYLTLHRLLFGPVYGAIAGAMTNERDAFLARVALYVIFGACLITVSVIADYTRVAIVVRNAGSAADSLRHAARFVRRHWPTVVTLYLITGLLFVLGFVFYGLTETYGGTRVAGWRAVAIAQAFIVGRLIVRLLFAASEGRLFRLLNGVPAAGDRG